jgi:PAS domain-containing protein
MEQNYKTLYTELLQFLYRTPWGLLQTARNGDVQMLNPVAAMLLMPLSHNGRLDNLFDLLRSSRPELQALVVEARERLGVVCEDLPLDGLRPAQAGQPAPLSRLSVSVFAQNADCLMVVLREARLQSPQRPAELRLAELEALQSLDRLGVIKTRQHRITWSNPAAQRLLDYSAQQLLDAPLVDLFAPGLGAALLEAGLPFWMAGVAYAQRLELLAKGGRRCTLELSATATSGSGDDMLWTLMQPAQERGDALREGAADTAVLQQCAAALDQVLAKARSGRSNQL